MSEAGYDADLKSVAEIGMRVRIPPSALCFYKGEYIMNLTDIEKGYIAGIIDGEGSICLTKQKANEFRSPTITVASTTYELVTYLQRLIGGSISNKKIYKENHKPSFQWNIKTNKTIELLTEIKDFLLVPEKQYRANLIVNEYKKVTSRNGKYTEEKLQLKKDFEKRFFDFNS